MIYVYKKTVIITMIIGFYINGKVILKKTLRFATIVNINTDGNIVVHYYDRSNKLIYKLITKDDIISPEQYEVIRNRNNTIIDILK
jgi:hypothetical protein